MIKIGVIIYVEEEYEFGDGECKYVEVFKGLVCDFFDSLIGV